MSKLDMQILGESDTPIEDKYAYKRGYLQAINDCFMLLMNISGGINDTQKTMNDVKQFINKKLEKAKK